MHRSFPTVLNLQITDLEKQLAEARQDRAVYLDKADKMAAEHRAKRKEWREERRRLVRTVDAQTRTNTLQLHVRPYTALAPPESGAGLVRKGRGADYADQWCHAGHLAAADTRGQRREVRNVRGVELLAAAVPCTRRLLRRRCKPDVVATQPRPGAPGALPPPHMGALHL